MDHHCTPLVNKSRKIMEQNHGTKSAMASSLQTVSLLKGLNWCDELTSDHETLTDYEPIDDVC